MNNLQENRRQRLHLLLAENALDVPTMAACLGMDEDKLAIILAESANRAITDNLAQKIEQTFSKPEGWLSQTGQTENAINYDLFGD